MRSLLPSSAKQTLRTWRIKCLMWLDGVIRNALEEAFAEDKRFIDRTSRNSQPAEGKPQEGSDTKFAGTSEISFSRPTRPPDFDQLLCPLPGVLEVVRLEGEVDLHVTPRIAAELKALPTVPNILVDLAGVTYIDSSGLAVLIEKMQDTERRGGRFGICGLRNTVRPIFEIARLDQVFEMPATRDDLLAFRTVSVDPIERVAAVEVARLNDEIMQYYRKYPEKLYSASPTEFEAVIVRILDAMQYEVHHVGGSGDGGRDILATLRTPLGVLMVVVQCKRYHARKPVPPEVVRSLMFVVNDQDTASFGLLATTSYFGPGALAIQSRYKHRLALADFERLTEWLDVYGKWTETKDSRLWVPTLFSQT